MPESDKPKYKYEEGWRPSLMIRLFDWMYSMYLMLYLYWSVYALSYIDIISSLTISFLPMNYSFFMRSGQGDLHDFTIRWNICVLCMFYDVYIFYCNGLWCVCISKFDDKSIQIYSSLLFWVSRRRRNTVVPRYNEHSGIMKPCCKPPIP